MALEMFLEGEAGVVGAQGDAALRRGRGGLRALGGLLQEIEHGENPLLDLVAAIGVSFVGAADGIADVLLEVIQRLVKFAQQERLLHRLRKQEVDGIHVAVGHAENIIRLLHQFGASARGCAAGRCQCPARARPARHGGWAAGPPGRRRRPRAPGNPCAPGRRAGRVLPPSGCDKHCRCKRIELSSFLALGHATLRGACKMVNRKSCLTRTTQC